MTHRCPKFNQYIQVPPADNFCSHCGADVRPSAPGKLATGLTNVGEGIASILAYVFAFAILMAVAGALLYAAVWVLHTLWRAT